MSGTMAKNDNEMILMRMRGMPAVPCSDLSEHPQNPNITFPPEMLPKADGPADVFVMTNDGKPRLIYSNDK